jgi:N-acetyl-gamma-glutamylphosphate reductase
VEIDQDGWQRSLVLGDPSVEVAGLVELMDNNPMVCGDAVSVPGPVSTLALVALGPLIRAGILLDEPVMQVGGSGEGEDVDGFLRTMGWDAGVAVSYGDEDFGGVVAANVVAEIATPGNWAEIDELYRESYARSFYVEESSDEPWDISLVKGTPMALYRLAYTPGEASSLLTVQVMADRNGKCGAAQVVHALNVMCGFEECDGIPELQSGHSPS